MLSSGVSRFSFDFFGLTFLKNFVRNPSNLPEIFGYRNFLCMRTENLVFPPKFLCLTVRKNFLGTTSKIQKDWDLGNFFAYHGFPSLFCLTVAKNFVRDHLMFQTVSNVRYRKNLCKRTEYHDFRSKFFCPECRKISLGNTSVYQKSSAIEKFHA